MCGKQVLNTKTKINNDKYRNNRQTYDTICFWKGDDKRSLIMNDADYAEYTEYVE